MEDKAEGKHLGYTDGHTFIQEFWTYQPSPQSASKLPKWVLLQNLVLGGFFWSCSQIQENIKEAMKSVASKQKQWINRQQAETYPAGSVLCLQLSKQPLTLTYEINVSCNYPMDATLQSLFSSPRGIDFERHQPLVNFVAKNTTSEIISELSECVCQYRFVNG